MFSPSSLYHTNQQRVHSKGEAAGLGEKVSKRNEKTATLGSDVPVQRKPVSAWKLAENLVFRFVDLVNYLANSEARMTMLNSTPSQHKLGIRNSGLLRFQFSVPRSSHAARAVFPSWHAGFCQGAPGLQTVHVKLSGKKRVEKVN